MDSIADDRSNRLAPFTNALIEKLPRTAADQCVSGEDAKVIQAIRNRPMQKLDLKKEWNGLYQPKGLEPAVVDVPAFHFLMVDGAGDPNGSREYQEAVEALFSASYATKFMIKRGPESIDYAVMPLEGLWWADDMSVFSAGRKDDWKWTLMIHQPACVTAGVIEAAVAETRRKKDLPGVSRLRFEPFAEGRCAQILHVGPFAEEGPTIARLHGFIGSISARRGKHHEIYLSDIRKAEPSKWRTIIRQPMA